MKKVFMAVAAVMMLFAACKPSEQNPSGDPSKDASKDPSESPVVNPSDDPSGEAVSVVLQRRNIDVAGDFDYDVLINEADKLVTVVIAYADADEAKALDVEFISLPSGVVADYVNPYDYSNGKTQEIVFKKNGSTDSSKWDKWTLGVEVLAEVPHLTSLTVEGMDILGDDVTLTFPNGMDLTGLIVTYTVSPEGSKVLADGVQIQSGDAVDFSDQLNGVTITVEGGDESYVIKAKTSGINKITRVWGHYLNPVTVEDNWYSDVLGFDWSVKENWDRNVAIDDQYVYLAATESNDGAGGVLAKIWAINISNDNEVIALTIPEDIPAQHKTAGLAVAPDGSGTRLLFSTMAMSDAHRFQVYSYTSPTAAPERVLDVPYGSIGERIGDRITFFGTWQKGEICAVSFAGAAYLFPVDNGKVSESFIKCDLKNGGLTTAVGGNGTKLVKYSETEYLWCGTGRPLVLRREGNTFTQELLQEEGFPSPSHGFSFFEVGGEKYAAFAARVNSYTSAEIRVFGLYYETLAESLEKNTISEHSWKFGLGDPDVDSNNAKAGLKDSNGIADTAARTIDGTLYLVGVGCGAGISLFKAE